MKKHLDGSKNNDRKQSSLTINVKRLRELTPDEQKLVVGGVLAPSYTQHAGLGACDGM